MSYGAAAALQTAVYQRLSTVPELSGIAIHDAVPPAPPGMFVLVGPEEARDESDKTGKGAEHRLVISVISDAAGFLKAKTIAGAVSDALDDAALALDRGRLVSLFFQRATARRIDAGRIRRIDMTFRARIEL